MNEKYYFNVFQRVTKISRQVQPQKQINTKHKYAFLYQIIVYSQSSRSF
jgi:hypothetical protein